MNKKDITENESALKSLNIEETKYKTNLTRKFENRKFWKKPDPTMISSVIPGTISKLYVKEKDEIHEGDKLLVLDAMKMKNTITVPFACVIKKINVEEGQTIPKGFVMAELSIKKKKN